MFDPRAMEGQNNPQAMNFGSSQNNQTPGFDHSKGKGVVLELKGQQEFNAMINNHEACVIDVFTEWCGPCQAIKLFFSQLPTQYPKIRFFKVSLPEIMS